MPLHQKLFGLAKIAIPAILIIFSSCHGASKTFSNAKQWLPADFRPASSILLVDTAGIKHKQFIKMNDHLKKKYHYQYQFVSAKNIGNDASYSDLDKYRFMMVISHTYVNIRLNSGSTSQPAYDFFFRDRLNKKDYPDSKKASSWPSPTFNAMINTILKETKS